VPDAEPLASENVPRGSLLTATTHHRRGLDELPEDDPRVDVGLYTTSEAARYLGLPTSTLQAWISQGRGKTPLVTTVPRRGYEAGIPFIGFAEAFVLQTARRAGVPRHRIRPGVEAVKAELGVRHALASRLLYTDGADLLVSYATEGEDLEVARTHQRLLTRTVTDQLRLITEGRARSLLGGRELAHDRL
jgi:Putative DNA-binding HTH domain